MSRMWKISVAVKGLTKEEVHPNLAAFEDEFRLRPWLVAPSVTWQEPDGPLIVKLEYGAANATAASKAVTDELMDCVVAYFRFQNDLEFDAQHDG